MTKALYRKYRSKSLDEIIGQTHITDVLKRSVEQGRTAHAYLLTGPRGVGKTSIARILAHEINKLPYTDTSSHIDIIEIDAASNNGVEDIRDLRDKVRIAPVSASKKVYIIDEVHMLSKPAFNALLKTLEEPPEHIVFILATTDVEKLPDTIVSRTQHFGFRIIPQAELTKHLAHIAKQEKIKITNEALERVAERGDGSFRDSISLLDQLASLADGKKGITAELVEQTLGLAPQVLLVSLTEAYDQRDLATTVKLLDEAEQQGIQGRTLASQLMSHLQRQVATSPHYVSLLDQLIDVERSPKPDIKLLTVLAANATPTPSKPKSSPLLAAAPKVAVDQPIRSLERKATQEHPKDPTIKKPKSTTAHVAPAAEASTAASSEQKRTAAAKPLSSFDGDTLVEHVRKNHVALYSVLSKCGFEANSNTLLIYTSNNFYKKKLDDTKYRPVLAASLEELGFFDVTIDTIPTSSPLKDEQAAKVAAIMGGGEEVVIAGDGK